ncbi:MAG: sigma-54 dependent transcriptional regulator [Alphaproteobacteria bacterium]|jgi:two-component system nitrogen regulation response regulator NtrX|nr:sigma-54 dependent transcriptional regulator [Alphaproteobacteria bacterium]MDP7174427.1 sigma-54 dependent transcriptional regulator [Alphaproteobacteria bacterium]MDP7232804.1 sigma-54 dependent transcriptional regulator [Alphaproteobacteria bacterium]
MATDILIVDDERDICSLISGILVDEGYKARVAGDADSALAEIEDRQPDAILLDIWLEGSRLDGMALLKLLKERDMDMPVIMISGHGNIETAVTSIKFGAYDFIEKPFEADRLLLCIERGLEAFRLRRENAELRLRTGRQIEIVGKSQSVKQLREAVSKVAPTGSRVLINGPAGSGKEVVARAIHAQSGHEQAPFVAINAAAITPERMEEKLFGVDGGSAVPGAVNKVGMFEQAHGGILYLDEISDMPLETQGKILRVLQEQTFQRVGGSRHIKVEVRVIASTSRDLQVEIAGKRFREDLFYRLNVVPLRVPSLNERRDDIPLLIHHFLGSATAMSGLVPRELSSDALAVLQTCDWPGNVRQLRNVIDWILIMAPGGSNAPVNSDMLPAELLMQTPVSLRPKNGAEMMGLPLREAREMFEKQYLERQVTRFGHNISRTASFVGMERSALHRKLKTLGITGDDR